MPRPLAGPKRPITGVRSCTADRAHERGLLRIVRVEAALPILESHSPRPFYAERLFSVPQSPDPALFWFRYPPAKPCTVLVEKVGDGEIRGERQCSVGLFRRAHRPKLEIETAIRLLDDLLLRRVDARRPARLF